MTVDRSANVAEAIAATLAAYDTEYYFCVTGGDHDLWLALKDAGITIINCRSEAAATYMADGYARAGGRPGFVYGQRGPGVANVAAALADAKWGLSPVISLTSAIHMRARERYQYQDVDTLPLYDSVASWNRSLPVPERASHMVRAAIRAAIGGDVPGPVHLEVPADLFAADAGSGPIYAEDGIGTLPARRVAPPPQAAGKALRLIESAERPVLLCGKGTVMSAAFDAVSEVSERFGMPVATTLGGKGSIGETEPLSVGVAGRYSRLVANQTVRESDLVLVLGSRLGGLATDGWTLPLEEKTLIQVDADPLVLGHNFEAELAVRSDVRLFLEALTEEAEGDAKGEAHRGWSSHVQGRVAEWRRNAEALSEADAADGIHPAAVIRDLRSQMGADDLLVSDTGGIAAWAGALFPVAAGRSFIRSAGSLGWALPGSIGAALARPGNRTVCLTGDGGVLYCIGELETMVRHGVPVVIVVLNNRAFASEMHLLRHHWNRELPEVTDFCEVDFASLARSFGAHGFTVTEVADLPDALGRAFEGPGPALVDVRISKQARAPAEPLRGATDLV